jgi:TolB-like protein/class 3 adenylate cyclase/Tfp pilus assembly protein PilF
MPTMDRAGGDSTRASLVARTAPVRFAAFTLDLDGCSLSKADGSDVPLTHNEFVALREFVRHPGRVLSRDYLLDALVGKRAGPFDRGVDVLVGRLRRKVEADPKRPRLIVTVPGEGYRFDGLTKTLSWEPSIAAPASQDNEQLADRGAAAGRKLAAILVADVVGYSRLAAADEERTLARLRGLRSDLIDPAIAAHHGRVVKRTGDGIIVEFRSVVDAARCALEVQNGMVERNAGLPPEQRIEFRVGIHVGDVVEESDGDLMGDGMNVAARLEGICEPGGIYLSDDAWRHVRDKINEPFTDFGEQTLKNIARPVRVFALKPGSRGATAAEPPRLSLVVLPFANIGGDPEQEYFVDGVTESLTTDLSRISGAFIIGRGTAFSYKGKAPDHRQVGRELNVRYVLEGSVQRSGNRLRVNVQLIEAESGAHLWAERFDKPVADLFDMQDEIVARLANQLQVELIAAEARRAEKQPNPDSMDLVFQGRALIYRGASPAILAKARGFFTRALELDRANIGALIGAAVVDLGVAWSYHTDDPRPLWAPVEAKLSEALATAPNNAGAHLWIGHVLIATNRAARGIEELERALALDPNLAGAPHGMGLAHTSGGRAEQAEARVLEALRLSPRDTGITAWFLLAGSAKAFLGEYQAATGWLRKSIDANRNNPWAYFYLAACLAHLGRLDEAHEELKAGLAVNPNFTIKRFQAAAESDNPVYLAQRERVIEGMRLAGAPEDLRGVVDIAQPAGVDALKSGASTPAFAAAVEKSCPPRLSLVVLPFANIGGDPEQEYFADGVTESLTTDLSRMVGAFVIGRNTAFTFKGKAVDLKQIGHELGVRYILEGSIQRGAGRMRVNVQLIDAETGSHLWGERFDKPVSDLLDTQDEIVAHVANALNTRLVAVEARRAEKAPDPDSMDLYFQGMAWVNKGYAITNMEPARNFFDRALAIDPNNADALVGSAIVDTFFGGTFFNDDGAKKLVAAETALTKALLLAPDHPMAHLCMGDVFNGTKRAEQAIGEFERALVLDHNFAAAHAHTGLSKLLVGRGDETEAHVREALRLSPRDDWVFMWLFFAGLAKLLLGLDEEAVARFRRSIETNRAFPASHFDLAAALAHLGRLEEARGSVSTGLALDPRFTISGARRRAPGLVLADTPILLANRERRYEGMGWPGFRKNDRTPGAAPRGCAPFMRHIRALSFSRVGYKRASVRLGVRNEVLGVVIADERAAYGACCAACEP